MRRRQYSREAALIGGAFAMALPMGRGLSFSRSWAKGGLMPDRAASVEPQIESLGEAALVLRFGTAIDEAVNQRVLDAWRALEDAAIPGVIESVPAYATLTVCFDPMHHAADRLATRLRGLLRGIGAREPLEGRRVELPVCYEGEHAPDIEELARHAGLSVAEVVRRHSDTEYRVFFIGFSPGFPYLGGLDPALAMPRRDTPRLAVPAGSVAIGGAQTGVYPQRSPGGWRLIGRTPLPLFDSSREPACLLSPGDRLRFMPVTVAEFARLQSSVPT